MRKPSEPQSTSPISTSRQFARDVTVLKMAPTNGGHFQYLIFNPGWLALGMLRLGYSRICAPMIAVRSFGKRK